MKRFDTLQTERLWLKLATLEDASFILKLLNTPKWKQFIGDRHVYTLEEAENYIKERMLPQHHKLGYGNYIVIDKESNVKMGSCGLYDRDGVEGLDIGFAFLPDYEGKGYAYESARMVMDLAINELNTNKISGITDKENFSSQKLLKKLGLKFKKMITLPNEDEEIMLFTHE